MILKTVRGKTPTYGNACFFAETAVIIGDVMLGDECSVWYHAVIRGDVHHIRIGNRVNIPVSYTHLTLPTNREV